MKPAAHISVAVVGATGYTGCELLRLLAGHPGVSITAVTSEKSEGSRVSAVFPGLASALPELTFQGLAPETIARSADVIFLALPHTKSLDPAAVCLAAGKKVVDLSADYRLKDLKTYEQWYGIRHSHPDLLKEAVYGLPELYRKEIRSARLVASPGCYPTAAILQLAPLIAGGLVDPSALIIDAKSGVSGAGRNPALPYHFPEANEAIEAYKIGRHRHLPEIEQELGFKTNEPVKVLFTPHLVPMNRGILSTAYARLRKPLDADRLRTLYRDFYKGERFIRICEGEESPNPRHLRGANGCHLGIFPGQGNWIVTLAALDNLVKGAAGQAIQAMNLMMGFPEEQGLLGPGVYP